MDKLPIHPYYAYKDYFGFIIFGIIFALILFFYPNLLGHSDNYIPANPLVTPEHIVPEWLKNAFKYSTICWKFLYDPMVIYYSGG